jgi:hypothetical protein
VFGGQDYPGNTHKTCFTRFGLWRLFEKVGLRQIICSLSEKDRAITMTGEKC